mmetsp:Transcript_89199/g.238211  ORF Transcript_89199/g.238211 Transcript_89199/m.238211 type:complete len:97 (-) Transcript_89199:531-821(-)
MGSLAWACCHFGTMNAVFSRCILLCSCTTLNSGVFQGNVALTSWLSMVISQIGLTVAIFIVVRSTKHAWDYSTSLSILHFCITCAVTGTAPTNWAW